MARAREFSDLETNFKSKIGEAADKVDSARSMDGSPFSMVGKPLKMKEIKNHAF